MAAAIAAAAEIPAAGPWRGVAVTDVQGWTMHGVTLRVAEDGAGLVIIRDDGAEKTVSFDAVAEVRDSEGRDITDDVLASEPEDVRRLERDVEQGFDSPPPRAIRPDANPEFDVPEPSPRAGRGHRGRETPPFGFGFDLGAGQASTLGDWFTGLDDGSFVQAGVRVGLHGTSYLHLVFRHQSLGSHTFQPDFTYPVTIDYSLDAYQVLVGTLDRRPHEGRVRTRAYVEGGGGLMEITGSHVTEGSASMTRFAFAAQAGLWAWLGRDVALDLGLHGFYKPGWLKEDEAGGATFGIQMALMFMR